MICKGYKLDNILSRSNRYNKNTDGPTTTIPSKEKYLNVNIFNFLLADGYFFYG